MDTQVLDNLGGSLVIRTGNKLSNIWHSNIEGDAIQIAFHAYRTVCIRAYTDRDLVNGELIHENLFVGDKV